MRSYAKANPADMAKLGECSDWPALAKWEQTRRAARLLELFDDQTVAAIASGEMVRSPARGLQATRPGCVLCGRAIMQRSNTWRSMPATTSGA